MLPEPLTTDASARASSRLSRSIWRHTVKTWRTARSVRAMPVSAVYGQRARSAGPPTRRVLHRDVNGRNPCPVGAGHKDKDFPFSRSKPGDTPGAALLTAFDSASCRHASSCADDTVAFRVPETAWSSCVIRCSLVHRLCLARVAVVKPAVRRCGSSWRRRATGFEWPSEIVC
jgi:hypothetical protein